MSAEGTSETDLEPLFIGRVLETEISRGIVPIKRERGQVMASMNRDVCTAATKKVP